MFKGLLKKIGKAVMPKIFSKLIGEGEAINKARSVLDRNRDGFVNLSDFPELEKYGDINNDGVVNLKDLVALGQKNNRKKLYVAAVVSIVVTALWVAAPSLLTLILSL